MIERINTVVIGAGQAGLAASNCLRAHGVPHIVLDQDSVAASWRRRWDTFALVTPNSMTTLPGFSYGGDPAGFMRRDDVVGYLEAYAASFAAPLRLGIRVHALTPRTGGWIAHTSAHTIECENVIVATGTYQKPRIPACASAISRDVHQLHSSEFRNADQLPRGAVLVVGSGQSGTQIANDLESAGRHVLLSVSRAGRWPRTYRGRDITEWLCGFGMFDRPLGSLESPSARFSANPHVSGDTIVEAPDLRDFAARGVRLLGRLVWADGDRVDFADDLHESIEKADRACDDVCARIDERIEAAGIAAPVDARRAPALSIPQAPRRLSLHEADVGTIIWATGYRHDYTWTGAPLDAWGYPVTNRGVTSMYGLYFVGLHWLHTFKSGLLYGVGEDAEHVVARIATLTKTPIDA